MNIEALKEAHDLSLDGRDFAARQIILDVIADLEKKEQPAQSKFTERYSVMKIATSELEHLREEVKNCHQIIKDLQKKREFVGLTDEQIKMLIPDGDAWKYEVGFGDANKFARAIEAAHGIKEKTND